MMEFESDDKIKNMKHIYNTILKEMVIKEQFTIDEIFHSVKSFLKVENMTEEKLYKMIDNVVYFLQKYQAYVADGNHFIKTSKATIKENVTVML